MAPDAPGHQRLAWQTTALLAAVGAAHGLFSWALLARHRTYHSEALDLGWFDQIVWNTAHGHGFRSSFVAYHTLGEHFSPVLLLFAALYRARPEVELLLLLQAAGAAWAAVPLYLAARRVLASATAGLFVALAYLLAPQLHEAVLYDFHPELLGIVSIFGAFALLVSGHPTWALAALGWVFLLKEDAALVGLGFAVVLWLSGARRHALAAVSGAVLYLVVVVGIVMPGIRGEPGHLQERYSYLGMGLHGVLTGALRHPDQVWAQLTAPAPLAAMGYLVGTQAALPLAGPAALAAVPVLVANLLSTHEPQTGLMVHYAVYPLALSLVAAVFGIRALARAGAAGLAGHWRYLPVRHEGRVMVLAGLLLLTEALGWFIGSPFGLRLDPDLYRRTAHTAATDRLVRAVPPDVPVSAQSGLLPHLSHRRAIWEFPRLEGAAVVVVDRTAWRSGAAEAAGYERTLAALPSLGYCLLLAADGVELYARGGGCRPG